MSLNFDDIGASIQSATGFNSLGDAFDAHASVTPPEGATFDRSGEMQVARNNGSILNDLSRGMAQIQRTIAQGSNAARTPERVGGSVERATERAQRGDAAGALNQGSTAIRQVEQGVRLIQNIFKR